MEKQRDDLQNEIKDYYKPMNKTPYYLHSIMIHDGNHESGHYYAFIKDFANDFYLRYNDIHVSHIDNERVQFESKGGFGTINAYCLVYVSQDTHQMLCQKDMKNHKLQFRNNPNLDYYNKLVSPELAEIVFQENDKELEDQQKEEATKKAKKIMDLYDERIKKVIEYIEQHKENKQLGITSPIVELIHKPKPNSPDNSHIAKWFLLNLCAKEATGIQEGLHVLENDDQLMKLLKDATQANQHPHAPKSMKLTDEDQVILTNVLSVFPDKLRNALVTFSVMTDITEFNFISAICTIAKRKQELNGDLKTAIVARDSAKVISLRLTSSINQEIIKGSNFDECILPCFQGLVFIFTHILPDLEDNHYLQVIENLKTTYALAKDKMGGYEERFRAFITLLEEENLSQFQLPENMVPKYPEELEKRLEEIIAIDHTETWEDIYHPNNLAVSLGDILTGTNNIHVF